MLHAEAAPRSTLHPRVVCQAGWGWNRQRQRRSPPPSLARSAARGGRGLPVSEPVRRSALPRAAPKYARCPAYPYWHPSAAPRASQPGHLHLDSLQFGLHCARLRQRPLQPPSATRPCSSVTRPPSSPSPRTWPSPPRTGCRPATRACRWGNTSPAGGQAQRSFPEIRIGLRRRPAASPRPPRPQRPPHVNARRRRSASAAQRGTQREGSHGWQGHHARVMQGGTPTGRIRRQTAAECTVMSETTRVQQLHTIET